MRKSSRKRSGQRQLDRRSQIFFPPVRKRCERLADEFGNVKVIK